MGLAGPKNRTKISADPNNTTWSKSTDRFGHKILIKQGWTPGSYLGAKDANHSSHYTAANASHIRVAVKDDNLGLGAKRGRAENDTFGLSAFQGLLGRLNGKSDGELKKEESIQRDFKLKTYQNQRWGTIRFVSGGLLVGDKIEDVIEKDSAALAKPSAAGSENQEDEKSAKKRKRSEDDGNAPKLKKRNRKSDLRKEHGLSSPEDSETAVKKKSKSKKAKKSEEEDPSPDNSASSAEEKDDKEKPEKQARKEAKRALRVQRLAKKEARKLEKEKRQEKKGKKEASGSESASLGDEATTSATGSTATVGVVQPAKSFAGGRLAVRQRYIAQKKRASMDPQALKEIFMIKAEA